MSFFDTMIWFIKMLFRKIYVFFRVSSEKSIQDLRDFWKLRFILLLTIYVFLLVLRCDQFSLQCLCLLDMSANFCLLSLCHNVCMLLMKFHFSSKNIFGISQSSWHQISVQSVLQVITNSFRIVSLIPKFSSQNSLKVWKACSQYAKEYHR